ncbi:unnamed protein product [Prunus brigantina]
MQVKKEKVVESGSKVACIVSQVLFYEQVRALKKSPEWCVFSSHLKMMCHYLTICHPLKPSLHKHLIVRCPFVFWPEIFKSAIPYGCNASLQGDTTSQQEENELDSSDDDGPPSLEANTNRMKPVDWKSDTESNSDSDTDS